MKKKKNIVILVILVVVVLLAMLLNSEVRSKEEVNNVLMEAIINDVDEILAKKENELNKASDILNLFMDEKNNGELNSHELNLVINNYEAVIIESMLDSDYEFLSQYSDKLKFINVLHIISGYRLKPWQSIDVAEINGQSIEIRTKTKDYEIGGDAFYFSHDVVGEVPEYFDFDAWLSLLSGVLSKQYPEKYPNSENISNGFKIIEGWTSEEFVIQLLNNNFLAYTYSELPHDNIAIDEFKTVDGITIFTMLINEENDVINLENLYKFGEKYSINEGVDYLNETYGKAKGNEFKMLDDWTDETINNPLNGGKKSNRGLVLTAIRTAVKSWML